MTKKNTTELITSSKVVVKETKELDIENKKEPTREINKDQENKLTNSEDQVESIRERITKCNFL